MDAEYYYLGGKYLSQNQINAAFVWNYLDNPQGLPYPLFSYWMPFASLLTYLPLAISNSDSFQVSRIIFWLLSSLMVPGLIFITHKITKNQYIAVISGVFALFNGFYFKYITITETITPYLILGGLFFYLSYLLLEKEVKPIFLFLLGIVAGLLQLTRVDGNLFFVFSVILILFLFFKKKSNANQKKFSFVSQLLFVFAGYFIPLVPYYVFMVSHFGSISSPVGIKALWTNVYDDTYLYPASQLTFQYWLSDGVLNKLSNIWEALKLNAGTFAAVQLNIFGIPLFLLGVWKNRKKYWVLYFLFAFICVFLLMTIVFPFAGSRGGFLHSGAAFQLFFWIFMAEGFYEFLLFGINHRGWKIERAKKMFTPALVLFSMLFTFILYAKDVIGDVPGFSWNADYVMYEAINEILYGAESNDDAVVMINNPVGFHYLTGHPGIAIPNAEEEDLKNLIEQFNVKYLVVDRNIPVLMQNYSDDFQNAYNEIGSIDEYELKIYQIP